ncbi:MAG: M56 family metallopeptidase, partial [Planctomycetota bacterium]|nr:M56 family metallopeptidase [Planctomycetota bacterium]
MGSLFLNTAILASTDFLASIAIRSLVLMLLVSVVAWLLRHRSAALLHLVWTAGLAGCLAIPLVMFLSPSWSLPVLAPEENVTAENEIASSPAANPRDFNLPTASILPIASPPGTVPIGMEPSSMHALPPTAPAEAALPTAATEVANNTVNRELKPAEIIPAAVEGPRETPSFAQTATAIWLLGLAALLLRQLWQTLAVRQTLRRARDLTSGDWHAERDATANRLGLRRPVALKLHPSALSPMVVGLLRPTVLLPADAKKWPRERRQQVLLHELAHVQRRDVLTQQLAAVTCAIYWFNPLVWLGAFQMRWLREIACDDAVVTHSGVPATYAQTLLDVAKRYRAPAPTGAVAMARSSNVENRITAILSATRHRARLSRRSVRILAAVGLLLAATIGTCQLTSQADDAAEVPTESSVTEAIVAEKEGAEKEATARPVEDKPAPEKIADKRDAAKPLTVLCVDATGKPVEGAEVYVWQQQSLNRKSKTHQSGPFLSNSKGIADCGELLVSDNGSSTRRIFARLPGKLAGKTQSSLSKEEVNSNTDVSDWANRVELLPTRSINGQVIVPAGMDASKVAIRARLVDRSNFEFNAVDLLQHRDTSTKPDNRGKFQLSDIPALGEIALTFTGDGMATTYWTQSMSSARSSPAPMSVEVSLPKEVSISGRVLSPDGEPAEKALVYLKDGQSEVQALAGFETPHAVTNAQGEFAFHGMPAGTYKLAVEGDIERWLEIKKHEFTATLDKPAKLVVNAEAGVLISGRVLDDQKAPLANVGILNGYFHARTDAEGKYRARVPANTGIPIYFTGQYGNLKPPVGPHSQQLLLLYERGETEVKDVDFIFTSIVEKKPDDAASQPKVDKTKKVEPQPLTVLCVDATGKPVEGAEVYLFQMKQGPKTATSPNGWTPQVSGPFKSDAAGKAACGDAIFLDGKGNFSRTIYARVPGKLVGVAVSAKGD